MLSKLSETDSVFILSGAGLSQASGVPTFRDANGLWEGHDIYEVATPEGWQSNPALVREFYDARRLGCASVAPNPAHQALARLQEALGPDRCHLVTQNVDGLLQRARAEHVHEMHGGLFQLRCEAELEHPKVPVRGPQPTDPCEDCGASLRPDIVWFGEIPYGMPTLESWLADATWFISIGTSGQVYPAAGFVQAAKAIGATTVEINPVPTGVMFDHILQGRAEQQVPILVNHWLES